MDSLNFEFLRNYAPDLAETGALAEHHLHSDPASAAVKFRILAEQVVLHICECLNMDLGPNQTMNGLLRDREFQESVPQDIRLKMDALRIHGNMGAHALSVSSVSKRTALWLLRETVHVMRWFFIAYIDDSPRQWADLQEPEPEVPRRREGRVIRTEEIEFHSREVALNSEEELADELAVSEPREPYADSLSFSSVRHSRDLDENPIDIGALVAREGLRKLIGHQSHQESLQRGEIAEKVVKGHMDT